MKRTLLALLLIIVVATPVLAHGTDITYVGEGSTVTVSALFDDLQPMAEAQLLVYSPDDPQNAFYTGIADAEGQHSFDIDTDIAGTWDVNVRLASHGEWLRIPVTENGEIVPMDASGQSSLIRSIAGVLIFVALVGIAYYFSRKPKTTSD